MPNVKQFKDILKTKKATWKLRPELHDDLKISDISGEKVNLGSLHVVPGTITARMPRIRRPPDGAYRLWNPNIYPHLRPIIKKLPVSWDWRNANNHNWVTNTRNQGGCGSCVAFAVTAAVESHRRIETNQPNMNIDLSEASLFFVANRQCNPGDPRYGWWVNSGLDAMVDEGICAEEIYPYRDQNQQAVIAEGTPSTLKITGYDSTSTTSQMKRWLAEQGPLVTSFTVYNDFFTFFNNGTGVYSHVTGSAAGGHAVTVVGYDDTASCWICKNSWGAKTAHPDGCFLIGYGECGIDSRMYLIQDVYDVITRDEIPYNPRTLRIVNEGANGWLLTDGRSRMKMFDNKEDARNGLRVARRHTRQGFVGRDNPRTARRSDYIMEYWTGSSGLPYEPLTKTDAIPYSPTNVVVEDLDAQGWRVKDGNHWMLKAHDMNDALAILGIVERHTRMCFIGRGNRRPNRKSYIMTYWE